MAHTLRILARLLVMLAAALATLPSLAAAQVAAGGNYTLTTWVVAGGGGPSSAGAYDLDGTLGQADAQSSAAGDYALDGGFWWRGPLPPVSVKAGVPLRFAFHPPAPNPNHGHCTLTFDVPRECHARADVFGVDGRRVAMLIDRTAGVGTHSVTWSGVADDGRAVAAGIYLVRLQAGTDHAVRRIVLLDR